MKSSLKAFVLGGVTAATIAAAAASVNITDYLVARPLQLTTPAMGDSTNYAGTKFDLGNMLDSYSKMDLTKLGGTIVTTDTTGTVKLTAPAEGASLTMLETYIRPERYMKGTLKVTSPEIFEVLVNDKSVQKKTAMQDSITAASTVSIPLDMQPQTSNKITFRVISKAGNAEPNIKAEFVPNSDFENVGVAISSDMKKRFQIPATEMGCRASGVSISPDGKYTLISYRDRDDATHTRYWADVVETASGKKVAANLKSGMRWMPKGSKLYFSEKVNDNRYNVYTMELPSLKQEKVLSNFPQNSFTWSPNEDYILYYNTDEGKKESGPMRRYTNPDDRIPGNRSKAFLVKYDMATGLSSPLTFSENSTTLLDITNDGKKVLYMTGVERPKEYPYYFFDIIQMDMQTFATDTIIANDGFIKGAAYSPDAKQLFMWAGPDFQDGIGLVTPPGVMPNNYDIQGYLYDIATKQTTPLTKDFNPAIEDVLGWNAKDGKIYVTAYDGFKKYPYAIDPRKKTIKQIPSKVDYVGSCSIGQYEDSWMVYSGGGFNYTGEAYAVNLKNDVNRLLDAPLRETTDNINWGDCEPWSFTASDGTVIDGYCVLPPDFDPAKKYPLIVYYYGGTLPTSAGMTSPYSPQLFASRDYVVYTLNPSGTIGYGQDFAARHVNAWGKYTADDIIEGTKEFCKQHPYVDSKKIGCIGASYGGFMTQYLLTQTDIFAAAVSHAGISNVASYWGEGYWGYSYNSVAASKSYPWNNPDLFTKQGSLFNADKIHTPLLLLHGTADTNVPIGESIQLFNALKLLDREVEFISVEGENHFIADYPKRELWHATIMAWFAKWLQDDPQWWNSMYGK